MADWRLKGASAFEDEALVAYTTYVYGFDGRLESIVHKDSANDEIGSYHYEYDDVGQLTSILDHGVLREFGYDATGQLTSEDEQDYTYDSNGNRDDYTYNEEDTNRLVSDGVWTYEQDAEGNMTKRENISSGLTWTYAYDHANQLVSAKLWDEDPDLVTEETLLREVEYKYDVFGNRVQKTIDWDGEDVDPAEVMKFAIDGWNPAKGAPIGNENNDIWGELSAEDLLTTKYLRSDVVDALFARVEVGGDAFWFLNDHLGSIRDIISNDALIQDDVNYDAFGNITEDSAYRGRYGWTGREWDVETELQYNRARYYDPTTGRWISQDPLSFDAGDSNLYRYVHNEPIRHNDPSGLQANPDPDQVIAKTMELFRRSEYAKKKFEEVEKRLGVLHVKAVKSEFGARYNEGTKSVEVDPASFNNDPGVLVGVVLFEVLNGTKSGPGSVFQTIHEQANNGYYSRIDFAVANEKVEWQNAIEHIRAFKEEDVRKLWPERANYFLTNIGDFGSYLRDHEKHVTYWGIAWKAYEKAYKARFPSFEVDEILKTETEKLNNATQSAVLRYMSNIDKKK